MKILAKEFIATTPAYNVGQFKPLKGLKNHDSFVICPGKRPVRINKDQTVSVNIYSGVH